MSKNFIEIYAHKKFKSVIPFNDFTKRIFICDNGNSNVKKTTKFNEGEIGDFIKKIIYRLIENKQINNLLTTGYYIKNNRLEVKFFYPGHKIIFRKDFFKILEQLGKERSVDLLTKCSIFYKYGNMVQFLVGDPNIHISYIEKDKIDKNFLYKVVNFRKIDFCDFEKFNFLPAESKKIKNFIYKINKIDVKKLVNVYFKEGIAKIKQQKCEYYIENNIPEQISDGELYISQAIAQFDKIKAVKACEENYKIQVERDDNKKINHHYILPKQIINFLFMISKKTMGALFNEEDFKILKSKIAILIYKPKNEKLVTSELMHKFKVKNIKFMHKKNNIKNHHRRKEILNNLLKIIFNKIYMPIISTSFYSTETNEHKSTVVYILKQNWYKNLQIADKKLMKNLTQIKTPVLNTPYATTRFLPKGNDYRQIINMRKSVPCEGTNGRVFYRSYNSATKIPFTIFNSELNKIKTNENFTFNFKNIFYRLHSIDFKNKYILKFDVKKCYDNIDVEKLKDVILKCLNPFYIVEKGFTYSFKNGLIFKNYTHKTFNSVRKNTGKNFTIPINSKIYSREEIYAIMEKNIKNIKIKFNNKFYEKSHGIPQGSNIGHFLCTFFFLRLNELYLNEIFKSAFIFRFVDDFLIISDNLFVFKEFLEKLTELEGEGMKINLSKIEANFNFKDLNTENEKSIKIDGDRFVSWCGLRFNTRGIKLNKKIQTDSLSHLNNYKRGEQILLKIDYFLQRDVKSILFIRNFYREQNVYDILRNIFSNLKRLIKRLDFFNKNFILRLFTYLYQKLVDIFNKRHIYFNEDLLKKIYISALESSKIGKFLMGKFFDKNFENEIIENILTYDQEYCNFRQWEI